MFQVIAGGEKIARNPIQRFNINYKTEKHNAQTGGNGLCHDFSTMRRGGEELQGTENVACFTNQCPEADLS